MPTLALLVLAGTLSTGAARPDAAAVAAEEVRAVLNGFDAAMTARNLDGVMATLSGGDDLALFLPLPYMPMRVDGTVNARKAFEIFFRNIPKPAAFLVTHHDGVVQVHQDTAVAYSYHVFFLSEGALPTRLLLRTTMILLKRDGTWRIVHLHSATLPDVGDFIAK